MPTLDGELEAMAEQAERWRPAAFKTYTQFGPPDGPAGFFLDDERHGTPFIERARALGVRTSRSTRACHSARAATSTRSPATSARRRAAIPT